MSTNSSNSVNPENSFDAERIGRELDALQPNMHQLKRERFMELFQAIRAAKERGVPTKQILAMLGEHGLKLSAATFSKLYEDASRESATATQTAA